MAEENYKVVNNENQLQFEIELDGEKAFLSYRFYKGDIALMHTKVPEAFAGKGMASALAKEAFNYAEKSKKLVIVYCPFVAKFLENHREYEKFLDPEYRGRN